MFFFYWGLFPLFFHTYISGYLTPPAWSGGCVCGESCCKAVASIVGWLEKTSAYVCERIPLSHFFSRPAPIHVLLCMLQCDVRTQWRSLALLSQYNAIRRRQRLVCDLLRYLKIVLEWQLAGVVGKKMFEFFFFAISLHCKTSLHLMECIFRQRWCAFQVVRVSASFVSRFHIQTRSVVMNHLLA